MISLSFLSPLDSSVCTLKRRANMFLTAQVTKYISWGDVFGPILTHGILSTAYSTLNFFLRPTSRPSPELLLLLNTETHWMIYSSFLVSACVHFLFICICTQPRTISWLIYYTWIGALVTSIVFLLEMLPWPLILK